MNARSRLRSGLAVAALALGTLAAAGPASAAWPTTTVVGRTFYSDKPVVATDSAGDTAVAWICSGRALDDMRLCVRETAADGTRSGIVRLSPAKENVAEYAVDMDESGRVVVAWIGYKGRYHTVYARSWSPQQSGLSPVRILAGTRRFANEVIPYGELRAGVDPVGNAVVAWNSATTNSDTFVTRTMLTDGTLTDPTRVPNAYEDASAVFVVPTKSHLFLAWSEVSHLSSDEDTVYVRTETAPGSFSAPVEVAAGSLTATAAAPSGKVAFGYVRGAAQRAFARTMDSDGTFGTEHALSSATSKTYLTDVAVSDQGRVFGVFQDGARVAYTVRSVSADGIMSPVRSVARRVDGDTDDARPDVDTGLTRSGRLVMVWRHYPEVRSRTLATDGSTLSPVKVVGVFRGAQVDHTLATSPSGRVTGAWTVFRENRGGGVRSATWH